MTVRRRDGRPAHPIWLAPLSNRRPGEAPAKPSPESLAAGRLRRMIEAREAARRLRTDLDWLAS